MADHQTKSDSFMEAVTNTTIGYSITLVASVFIFPAFGVKMSAAQMNGVVGTFTVISVIRSYVIRRIFNGRTPWQAIKRRFS